MRDGISLLDQLISSTAGKLDEPDVLRVLGTPPDERIGALLAAIADNNPAARWSSSTPSWPPGSRWIAR